MYPLRQKSEIIAATNFGMIAPGNHGNNGFAAGCTTPKGRGKAAPPGFSCAESAKYLPPGGRCPEGADEEWREAASLRGLGEKRNRGKFGTPKPAPFLVISTVPKLLLPHSSSVSPCGLPPSPRGKVFCACGEGETGAGKETPPRCVFSGVYHQNTLAKRFWVPGRIDRPGYGIRVEN